MIREALAPTSPALVLALLVTGCGGSPSPQAAAPAASAEPVASAAPAASPAPNAAAVELCLATANAKRARFSGEPAKIGVKHVLVKWNGSKNPREGVSRSREDACLRAIEARDKIRGGADFADVVKEYSDEKGAATRMGSLGSLERKDLAKPFADAAFELSINMLSDVVETEFGFHVITRTE